MNFRFRFEILLLVYISLGGKMYEGSACSAQANNASVLKFCTDVSRSGNILYLDSLNAGAGNVSCSCYFKSSWDVTIFLIANSIPNKVNGVCKKHLRFEFNPDGIQFSRSCLNLSTSGYLYESRSLEVTLLGEQIKGAGHYCIKVYAVSSNIILFGTCSAELIQSTPLSTTTTTTTVNSPTELKTEHLTSTDYTQVISTDNSKINTDNLDGEIDENSKPQINDNKVSVAAIVVPVLVLVLVAVAVIFVGIYFWKRRNQMKTEEKQYANTYESNDAHNYDTMINSTTNTSANQYYTELQVSSSRYYDNSPDKQLQEKSSQLVNQNTDSRQSDLKAYVNLSFESSIEKKNEESNLYQNVNT